MKPTSRNHHLAALATAVISLVAACHFEPLTPQLNYSENEGAVAENNLLADEPDARAHLAGALEFLFGTPANPSYTVLPEWVDEEFDPNYWGYDSLSAEEFDALKASNAFAYREQIAAIEAGDLSAVKKPFYVADLWENFQSLVADAPADLSEPYDSDDPEWTWTNELVAAFESYYPNMGTTAEMYRQQCFHCHGAEGGGNGSTADFLNPRPRDYRPGIFKFTALNNKARPRHRDLTTILEEGIYTSAMPSFRRFTDAQLSGFADYVRMLSIRGETEILMAADFDPDEGIHFENLQENYKFVLERWRDTDGELIVFDGDVPESTPERVARGRDLFIRADAANCVKCHGATGRGDGESVKNNPEDAIDDWGEEIKPRDLTRGVFRFGRRPIDLYRRVYAGINGTPMPAHFDMQIVDGDGNTRNMNEDDLWDLVFFARSLAVKSVDADSAAGEESH